MERLGYAVLDRIVGGEAGRPVFATGGGSRSDVWMQLRSDVTGRPYHRPAYPESAFGSAVLAAGAVLHDDVWAELRKAHGTELLLGTMECTGTDACIECTGVLQVMKDIIAQAKPHTHISVPALHRENLDLSLMILLMKQLRITGSMEYPDDFGQTIELLRNVDLSPLITHRFALDDFEEAIGVARDTEVAGKVMIELAGQEA